MKKLIINQLAILRKMVERIEEYNEYLNDNSYSERHSNKQLSYNVKIYEWLDKDDVTERLKSYNLGPFQIEAIINEFDDDRLNGIKDHILGINAEYFRESVEDKESPFYGFLSSKEIHYYGRGGGHLCLGDISHFEINVYDTELNYYPIWEYKRGEGTFIKWDQDIDEMIQQFKDYFGVTTQKEVYKLLKKDIESGDINDYYKAAISNQALLEKLEEYIKEFKAKAKKYMLDQLNEEIENFIQNEFGIDIAIESAEHGDYSQLDTIKEVNPAYLLTSQNAKVPTDKAKELLTALIEGKDVTGQSIGAFKVNMVKKTDKDTYVKIGCHLFSLNQAKLQLAS